MTIAVHISHTNEQGSVYLEACFSILTKLHPEHRYIFLKEKNQPALLQETNCRYINISPSIKNNLLLHYWYNYKLPGLLQKYNADLFVNDNSVASLRTTVRQCMLVKDIQNIQHLENRKKGSAYAKKFFSKFVSKADVVCSSSDFIKNLLQQHVPNDPGKIQVIYHGLSPHYQQQSHEQKTAALNKYCNGFSYFFYEVTGNTAEALLPLLKAFSQFKKWQKSSFKLLLLYKNNIPAEPVEGFNQYKFRQDVVLKSHSSTAEAAEMMAAAYAVIYLPKGYNAGFTGLHTLKCGIPLICVDDNICKSLYANAARYCEIKADDIAKQLISVYKEESYNNILIQKGIQLTEKYSWHNAANLLWNALLPE